MEDSQIAARVARMIDVMGTLIPDYMANPLDRQIANGNVAACFIDADGNMYGKIYDGNGDRIRQRQASRVAWIKATQVWITGVKTLEFEKLVFSGQLDPKPFGIDAPDFIGWEGGQPISFDAETVVSVGFSGFRGVSDIEIVQRALTLTQD